MTHIYKVGYNVENNVSYVFVFIGSQLIENKEQMDIDKLFINEPTNALFKGIFSPDELNKIAKNNTQIRFIDEQIHVDDTISTLKKKLIKTVSKELNIAFEDIYLFIQQQKKMTATMIYQMLTQNEKIELTNESLMQFLLNINNIDITTIASKDVYDLEDIIGLDIDDRELVVDAPLGQTLISIDKMVSYTINPFNVLGYDPYLERNAKELITTTNQNLLMDTGILFNEMTIYICKAEDVLTYARKNDISEESTIKIYFPYLFEKNILNLSQLESQKQKLLMDAANTVEDTAFITNIENINLFYDIYNGKTKELEYIESGIKQISFTINPAYAFELPLATIFKLIHASINIPLIKYNPSKRQEKLYRLYTDKIATNGRKIPYLSKSTIYKLIKEIGGNKQVAVYIEHRIGEDSIIPIICEFESNGSITIKIKLAVAVSVAELNTIINTAVNPVIDIVKNYLSQSGYTMNKFETIAATNLDINELDYIFKLPITKKLNLNTMTKCLSSVFNVISSDVDKGAVLRFKRVAHYNEMESIEAYIVEMLNKNLGEAEVITGLMSNYNIKTQDKAREKLADFASSLNVMRVGFKNKKLKIKNNPGFLTTMTQEKFNSNLIINITGINDINYLNTIQIYVNSLLRITQDPKSTNVANTIKKLCKGKKVRDELQIADIIAPLESTQTQIAKELVFDEKDEQSGMSMLDILMGSDGDDDEEEEEEEEEQEGGAAPTNNDSDSETEDISADITGLSLANPNPFFERLNKREPSLFLTENEGGFSAYSRICPWNVRRQPVILTESEKSNIDKNHKGSYDEAIEYKSSKDGEKYYYICPRYWSIKDNVSITEKEAKSGKYGSIIPKDAKKVPKGAGVFEFTSSFHTDADGKYNTMHPGFLKSDKHPKGLCIPCCFNSWNSKEQQKRREICSVGDDDTGKPKIIDEKENIPDDYIKGADKFPIEPSRYGYLPLALQRFLGSDSSKCQKSATNKTLKANHICILRRGVEVSKNQSFIACIADAWSDIDNTKPRNISIAEFKEVLIKAMDIDTFITLQNGNLIGIFDTEDDKVNINKYKNTKIYKTSITISTPARDRGKLALIRKIARSYENFIRFLRDDTVTIDYRHLWDLICIPNPTLFYKGVNLVILELTEDDITNNIKLICPTNHYSNSMFDAEKDTIIIMKQGNYYEPLYSVENKEKTFYVGRRFNKKFNSTPPNITKVLDMIKKTLNDKCTPLPSMPSVYKFGKNISLHKLAELLKTKGFIIETQIINYGGKVIGVVANNANKRGIIPCFPSAPIIDLTPGYTWMDDKIGDTYENTKTFLTYVYSVYNRAIPCKPSFKIIEDGLIVGILTQTNQFVPLSEPILNTFGDDMPAINSSNYAVIDKYSSSTKKEDTERTKYIKNIKLEGNFYNIFRNTTKTLLGTFKNRKVRQEIEKIISSPTLLYVNKLKGVDTLLRELTKNDIIFTKYSNKILAELTDITSCNMDNAEVCNSKKFCITGDNGNCMLVIPDKNLINKKNNAKMYFGRMADELIRYSRIKSFMFKTNTFLSFADLKYNLHDNEIILLHSIVTQDYFDNNIVAPGVSYIKYNTYDTAQPLMTQAYTSDVDTIDKIKDKVKDKIKALCEPPIDSAINSKKWKVKLPANTYERKFNDATPSCSFEVILTLIKHVSDNNKSLTSDELKEVLVDEYNTLFEENMGKIQAILTSQGKDVLSKKLMKGELSLENMIMNDNYYATNIDIWILAVKYNIPIIFISSTQLVENDKSLLVAHSDGSGKYFLIKSPGVAKDNIPKYRIIITPAGSLQFSLTDVSVKLQNEIRENTEENALMKYIDNFTLTVKPAIKKPRLVIKQ